MRNDAQLTVGGVVILIAVIVIIIGMMWFIMLPPSCDKQYQAELTGTLLGFERNSSHWDVKLGNTTYIFQYFDKGYMEKFISHNITITACDAGTHYDFLSAYINENGE